MSRIITLTSVGPVLFGAALALTACSNDLSVGEGGSGGSNTPLTRAEAQALTDEMRGEIAGFTSGMSLSGWIEPEVMIPTEASAAFRGPRVFTHPDGCPTLSENPPTDADHDWIPDDLTLTYTLEKCTFTNERAHAVFTIDGTIHIVDPSQTDRAIRVEFGSLEHKLTVEDTQFWLRRVNGPWQILTSAGGFDAIDSTSVRRESSNRPTSELVKAWKVTFEAEMPLLISLSSRLPSGDLTVNGSTTRTRGDDSKSFEVTTITPLHFDATCDADDKIVSGELDIELTRGSASTTINIKWNGCGVDPIVTITPPPTS
jgi:hypothetical protein